MKYSTYHLLTYQLTFLRVHAAYLVSKLVSKCTDTPLPEKLPLFLPQTVYYYIHTEKLYYDS